MEIQDEKDNFGGEQVTSLNEEPVKSTFARYNSICKLCLTDINCGDTVYPLLGDKIDDKNKKRNQQSTGQELVWAHVSCLHLLNGIPPPPPCRHWMRMGRCAMFEHGMCVFLHEESIRGKIEAKALAKGTGRKARGGKNRTENRNNFRNTAFRIFLMKTFSLEYLKSGVVFDIAGGKGLLSWEMKNLMGIESVIVEPKCMLTYQLQKKWKRKLYEPNRVGPLYSQWNPACEQNSSNRDPVDPSHVKTFFVADEWNRLIDLKDGDKKDYDDWLTNAKDYAKNFAWTKKTKKGQETEEEDDEEEHAEEYYEERVDRNAISTEIIHGEKVYELWHNCKLLCGMHPDAAAGEIAMYGIRNKLPWAVVPCCVFKSKFPNRRLLNGQKVETYNDLVQWLTELHPNTNTCQLDFEGQNICVYVLPNDV